MKFQRFSSKTFSTIKNPFGVSINKDFPSKMEKFIETSTKLSNGIKVISIENHELVSKVGIVINSGSSQESIKEPQGVAHMMKSLFARNTNQQTIFKSIRDSEMVGASLYADLTREHHIFGSEFLRDSLNDQVPLLVNHTFNDLMNDYEFLDIKKNVSKESQSALADSDILIDEKLHSVAFRNTGLGQSLYANPDGVSKIKKKNVQDFFNRLFVPDNISIVATGVNHDELVSTLESAFANHKLPSSSSKSFTKNPSKYFGGESRIESANQSQYLIAFPVEGGLTGKNYATALVLEGLLDGTKRLEWGSETGTLSYLSKASTPNTHAVSFCQIYSNNGLMGIKIIGDSNEITQVAQKAISNLKNLSISENDLNRAKNVALLEHEINSSTDNLFEKLSYKAFNPSIKTSDFELKDAISKVTSKDVQDLAKSIIASKPSAVAFGDTRKLPYIEDLKI